jgi:hypothetical protein
MSLDARMSVALDFTPTCGFWAVLVLTSGTLTVLLDGDRLHTICVALLVYALQALIAECIGVRVTEGRISAPRRVHQALPQLVLWRTGGLLCDVSRVASIAKYGNGGEASLRWLGDLDLPIMFANRDLKLAFFECLRQQRPEIAIYRRS